MASKTENLHFLLLPLMAQSHILPITDFAKLLANHGVAVTIITTPLNFVRFKPVIDRAITNKNTLKLSLVPIKFPSEEVGLPKGCENMDELTSQDLSQNFFLASSMMKPHLEKFLDECEPKISAIISSNALSWTAELSEKYAVPRYVFQTFSCFTLLCSRLISSEGGPMERVDSDNEPFLVPNIPHKVEITRAQLPEVMRTKSSEFKSMVLKMGAAMNSAQGMLVNSFEELEPTYAQGYRESVRKLWCIGPVSLCNKEEVDKFDRGKSPSVGGHNCLKWLDSMKPRSVIYACFGSLSRLSLAQIVELGLGLEASNRPFIWIIREQDCIPEVEKWLLEEGFEERVKGRGLVIRGWAPQVLILSHQSTGGFLTHCGWNSILEGVSAGVPMITWPMFADQFINEKFVIHVAKIGVKIGAEVFMNSVEEEKVGGALVKNEQVKKAIEEIMDEEAEEGEERRRRAKELGAIAKGTIEEGGSSYLNIISLIQDVLMHQSQTII
ncbi:hypothetical protein LguiA_032345 [Lonicera macranthoides]